MLAPWLDEHVDGCRASAAVDGELIEEARDVLEWRLGYAEPFRVRRLARLLGEWRADGGGGR